MGLEQVVQRVYSRFLRRFRAQKGRKGSARAALVCSVSVAVSGETYGENSETIARSKRSRPCLLPAHYFGERSQECDEEKEDRCQLRKPTCSRIG